MLVNLHLQSWNPSYDMHTTTLVQSWGIMASPRDT